MLVQQEGLLFPVLKMFRASSANDLIRMTIKIMFQEDQILVFVVIIRNLSPNITFSVH